MLHTPPELSIRIIRPCDLGLRQIRPHMSIVDSGEAKWWERWEPVANTGLSSSLRLCYCVATQLKTGIFVVIKSICFYLFSVIWGLPHPMMQLRCWQKRGMWHPLKLLLSSHWSVERRSCQPLCPSDVPKTCCYPGTGWELRKSFSNIKLYLWVWSFPFCFL